MSTLGEKNEHERQAGERRAKELEQLAAEELEMLWYYAMNAPFPDDSYPLPPPDADPYQGLYGQDQGGWL